MLPDCVNFPSYSVKCYSWFMLGYLMTSWHLNIWKVKIWLHNFLNKQRFFLTQPQFCLSYPWIELQMLLRCCLIHISIIILRHFLHLLNLHLCLDLGLFMSCLCDLFFIFIFKFIMINHILSWIHLRLRV